MPSFVDVIASSVDFVAMAILLVFVPFFVLFTVRAKAGHRFALRELPAYDRIRQLVSQAAEAGQPIHVGMGSGQPGGESTPGALMGVTVFEYVARQAATYGQPVLGTTGSAVLLSAAQGVLQKARRDRGFPEGYTSREINFYGPHPVAYAAGTSDALSRQGYLASILVGRFGAEGLWLAESTSGAGITQLGGTSEVSAAALMHFSLDEAVVGEEVFAAGAYLDRPSHLGSLATQDLMRIVTIVSIVAGVVCASLGYWG